MSIMNDKCGPDIYEECDFYLLKEIPKLDDGQIYVYVMHNSAGNIKIGKTTNIVQRLKSLSGSNCAGERIDQLYCSPATWLHSIETTCHNHYHFARISGEWFSGEKLCFADVVEYVDSLFRTDSYQRCNVIRSKGKEKTPLS